MARDGGKAFAIWITGLPASGKSTLTRALVAQLADRGLDAAVLESDAMRQVFTPDPTYDEKERTAFYGQMTWIGTLLVRHGVAVIFDATANRRCLREDARRAMPRLLEVYVECPLEVCMARDPKGIYRNAARGEATNVPGIQAAYEPPENPDVVVFGDREKPEQGARRVIAKLEERGYLQAASA